MNFMNPLIAVFVLDRLVGKKIKIGYTNCDSLGHLSIEYH